MIKILDHIITRYCTADFFVFILFKENAETRYSLYFLFRHNTEKVIYFLLLDRKLRNPSLEDEEEIKNKSDSGKDIGKQISF